MSQSATDRAVPWGHPRGGTVPEGGGNGSSTVVLEIKDLTKRFGRLVAVDHLSLTIHQREVFGFLGPNGAGKSTAISMICGLLRPDEGQIEILGRQVGRGSREVRTCLGVCPQSIVLWKDLTCLEQLEFVGEMYGVKRDVARRRGLELLGAVGLAEKRNHLARTLSGGMQRRLNLILALVHDPEILVLDEPEVGLDPQSRVLVREFIRSMRRSKTILLTTHNMDEADRVADRVGIIDHGRLLMTDSPDALKRSVGEGDVLEIEIVGGRESAMECAERAVCPLVTRAFSSGRTLVLRAPGIVPMLGRILDTLGDAGLRTGDVRLRQNTLEDVFISLTGRRLRE